MEVAKQKLIYHKGFLFSWDFYVTFKLLLQLGDTSKAASFLEKNKKNLYPKYRNFIYSFCRALLLFESKDFQKSLDLLNKTPINNKYQFYLDARRLEIQIFFELKERGVLESKINAFKVLLSRDRNFPKKRKERYLNFVNLVARVVMKANENKIEQAVKERMPFEGDVWLLEKINS